MKSWQHQFIKLSLNNGALKFGEFVLKSGRNSPYFFNAGFFNTGSDLSLLGRFYAQVLLENYIEFDLLFGSPYKGIPIVVATSIALINHYNRNVSYCFNRKEIKDHGEHGLLVGSPIKGKVIILDDVITSGTTIRKSINIINAYGATLAGVLISLDRQERGCTDVLTVREIEHNYQCKVVSIISLKEIISYLEGKNKMSTQLEKIRVYQKKYGI